MAGALDSQLVTDVKGHLGITWSDPDTERRVETYIRSGMAYLDGKLGEHADYTLDGTPRTLLFEFCRYFRDGALDVFETNYLSMILAMQNERRVSAYATENAVPGGE